MPDTPSPRRRMREWYSRGYLPHRDRPRSAQFLTFRLNDSAPVRLLRAYARVVEAAKSAGERERAEARVFSHLEQFLAKGRGSCRLGDNRAARIVEDSLLFRDGTDYDLIAWVVMPNHVHAVVRPGLKTPLEVTVRKWKSWTAHEIHRTFGSSGRFWQPEVFDRWLRSVVELEHAIRYVEMNPVLAGLCNSPLEWRFSSARRRPERWAEDSRGEMVPD